MHRYRFIKHSLSTLILINIRFKIEKVYSLLKIISIRYQMKESTSVTYGNIYKSNKIEEKFLRKYTEKMKVLSNSGGNFFFLVFYIRKELKVVIVPFLPQCFHTFFLNLS